MNKIYNALLISALAISTTFIAPARAQQNKDPIVITADGSLEWYRNDKKFLAKKNASATQGEVSIRAQTLGALYRDDTGKKFDIYKMTGDQNVIISTKESQAFGQHLDYNVDQELAIMTGDNLKLLSPDQTLIAQDKFEYHVAQGRLDAIGKAKIIRPKETGGEDTLQADIITATFTNNERGERVLKTMKANGHVIIVTPTETITGSQGVYNAETNTAQLSGGVTIKRGPNVLEGSRADIDLTTNTSTLSGSNGKKGRVRGVFYPGSEKGKGK